MTREKLLPTVAEILVIVVVSALAGVAWNRTLLQDAWHGKVTALTQQAQAAAPKGEELPMPIGMEQLKEMHAAREVVVVDARNAASFAEGHITGALSLPVEEARKNGVAAFAKKVPTGATVVAYCNGFSCHDSMDLARVLMRAGYPSVYVYEGGFPEWRDAGYPTATGAP